MASSGIIALLLIALANSNTAERLIPKSPQWQVQYEKFITLSDRPIVDANNPPIPKYQVTYFLFSEINKSHPVELTEDNLHLIDDSTEKLFVLVHGWLEYKERPWYNDLKDALLASYPKSKVIQVDYMEPAFDYYPSAVSAAKYVGQHIGEFLIKLSKEQEVPTNKIILIGHSLGSHVSGIAGKTVQKSLSRLGRIIALDPAGPPWQSFTCEKRLCRSDAEVVAALHTDIGRYGYGPSLGTIDFYPNGGGKQKGCDTMPTPILTQASEDTMCDHWRSWAYFIEAIRNQNHYISTKCKDWSTFEQDMRKCDPVKVALGDMESTAEGNFYFYTNGHAPFAVETKENKVEL